MLKIIDIAAVAGVCRPRGVVLAVDNTFMTPYFQRPLELGADVVAHSLTKYLNGHSDVVGGALIVKDAALRDRLAFLQNAVGAVISVIGTLSDYRPRPFLFVMTKAELADESLPVAGGACADPRPQMCTRDYRPACGIRRDGSRKTYGNACTACADPDVLSQEAGDCP